MPSLLPRESMSATSVIPAPFQRPSPSDHRVGFSTSFTRLLIGSLALRPALLLLENSRPRVATAPLPHATEAYGQLHGRDFNPLDLLLLLRTARFWARTLDLLVVTLPALILSSTIGTVDGGSSVLFLLAFGIAVLLPFFLDACVVGLFGNSLGKALLGITVHHKDGRKPGFHDILKRNLYVCGYGYWTGLISFVSWIPMLIAYRDLRGKKGETKWDAALGYEVRRTSVNVGQIVGFAVAFGFALGVVLSVSKYQTGKQELKAGGLFADIPDATNKQTLKQLLKAATNYFDQFDAPHADIAAAPKSPQATAPRDPVAERDSL